MCIALIPFVGATASLDQDNAFQLSNKDLVSRTLAGCVFIDI